MEAIIIKYLVEYGILGILGFFFIKQQNKNFAMIQEQYKTLVDNLIFTQKETLKELKKSVDSLTIIIKSRFSSNIDESEIKYSHRDFSSD